MIGTCPTERGQVNGSLPPGTASPKSRSATAAPPCVPGYQTSRIAGTCSAAQRRSSGRPFITSSTVGVPVATTACSSSSWRPGSSRDDREAASPIMFCHSPSTTTATSASVGDLHRAGELGVRVEPLRVLRRRCRRTCRTSTGTCAAPTGMPRAASRARRRRRGARMPSTTVTVSSRSKSKTQGPMVSRGESASGAEDRDGADAAGSSGRRSPSFRSSTADAPGGVPRDLAVRGIGEHARRPLLVDVRVVEQPEAQLHRRGPGAPPRRAPPASTSPAASASGRWSNAGSVIAISMSRPARSARAAAAGRSGAKPWVVRLRDGVRVADGEAVEARAPRAARR